LPGAKEKAMEYRVSSADERIDRKRLPKDVEQKGATR
jgi:hypothetical protein